VWGEWGITQGTQAAPGTPTSIPADRVRDVFTRYAENNPSYYDSIMEGLRNLGITDLPEDGYRGTLRIEIPVSLLGQAWAGDTYDVRRRFADVFPSERIQEAVSRFIRASKGTDGDSLGINADDSGVTVQLTNVSRTGGRR
jgi:hypothetical protein